MGTEERNRFGRDAKDSWGHGVRGVGTPGEKHLEGHGTSKAKNQGRDESWGQLWALEDIVRSLPFVLRAVGSHRGALSRDETA